MRVVWMAYDTLHKILSLKVLIMSLAVVLAIVFVCLVMSDYMTAAEPAWHDLFREHISRSYIGNIYFFAQMLLTPFIVIISTLAAHDMYRGEAEQIYLTGGLRKPVAFIGRMLGMLVYILVLWWTLFLVAGFVLIFTGLGNIDLSMVDVFVKLSINSVAISLFAYFLVGLTKVAITGILPILLAQYWLTVNSNITLDTAGSALHNAVNYLLPLNTFSRFAEVDIEYFDLLMQYQDLAPWHGSLLLITFALFLFLASLELYITKQDQ